MSMYTLKSIVQRGTMLGAVGALLVAAVVPAASVFADALNPLTERSLLLSSSAPGYQDTDGSGNSAAAPNAVGENYAPPGSGPNGRQSGETFTFNVSTNSTVSGKEIKGITFQYCTSAAGKCRAPGNNTGTVVGGGTRGSDNAAAKTSDLNVNYPSAVEGTDFNVYVNGSSTPSTGWTINTDNVENADHTTGINTGKQNFIRLMNTGGDIQPNTGQQVRIVFKASATNFITNPGDGAFFVKINTYSSATETDLLPDTDEFIIDGGVTVANVMTDSIHITTKVLETMSFSVGTRNRDTVQVNCAVTPGVDNGCDGTSATHGTCDPVQQVAGNRLNLGDPDAEYSLETGRAWDVYSYWRLSSNSSGGATVYYSGNTLANTVGDEIAEAGATAVASNPGSEQFGLGFVDATDDDDTPHLAQTRFDSAFLDLVTNNNRYKMPTLENLTPDAPYANATGSINGATRDATFAFKKSSNTVPEKIASDIRADKGVVSCATAKMRYVANIAADTPAGVYTTKINYLASPQY